MVGGKGDTKAAAEPVRDAVPSLPLEQGAIREASSGKGGEKR